jgi:hypothetical protein
MKKHLPTIVQAIGTTLVAMSLLLVAVPLGIAFTGAALITFGIAAERR